MDIMDSIVSDVTDMREITANKMNRLEGGEGSRRNNITNILRYRYLDMLLSFQNPFRILFRRAVPYYIVEA